MSNMTMSRYVTHTPHHVTMSNVTMSENRRGGTDRDRWAGKTGADPHLRDHPDQRRGCRCRRWRPRRDWLAGPDGSFLLPGGFAAPTPWNCGFRSLVAAAAFAGCHRCALRRRAAAARARCAWARRGHNLQPRKNNRDGRGPGKVMCVVSVARCQWQGSGAICNPKPRVPKAKGGGEGGGRSQVPGETGAGTWPHLHPPPCLGSPVSSSLEWLGKRLLGAWGMANSDPEYARPKAKSHLAIFWVGI